MAEHEGVGRTAVGSLLEQEKNGAATHTDAVREHSSNDGGEAFEEGKRQKGMREADVGSDFRVEIVSGKADAPCGVPVWMMKVEADVVPGEEQG